MNASSTDQSEAREILDAMRQIQADPKLASEARKSPESVVHRLALSNTARHAVALGLTAAAVGAHIKPSPDAFWF